jgi:hypothetical protein
MPCIVTSFRRRFDVDVFLTFLMIMVVYWGVREVRWRRNALFVFDFSVKIKWAVYFQNSYSVNLFGVKTAYTIAFKFHRKQLNFKI